MKRIFLLCSTLLVLTGCATAAQRQSKTMDNVVHQAGTGLHACVAEVYHNPDYEVIMPHVPLNMASPTMAQLADDTRPTKDDGQLLIKFHDDILPCRQAYLQKIQNVVPGIAQVMSEGWVETDKIMMKLVKRKITWGEATQQTQQVTLEVQKNIHQAGQQIDSALAASHQAELAQRQARQQAIANALQQWSAQMQRTQTHINCTSMNPSGTQVFTDCNGY